MWVCSGDKMLLCRAPIGWHERRGRRYWSIPAYLSGVSAGILFHPIMPSGYMTVAMTTVVNNWLVIVTCIYICLTGGTNIMETLAKALTDQIRALQLSFDSVCTEY